MRYKAGCNTVAGRADNPRGKPYAPRVCLLSLGCPKNQVDSESALGVIKKAGWEIVAEPARAEALIVNTCAFIRAAEEETIKAVLEAASFKKKGSLRFLMVVGCWVSKHGVARIKKCVPEVDAVGRPGEVDQWIRELAKHFGTFVRQGQPQRFLLSGPGTAYLKIAEGCSRRCTFCLIPALRGPLHSRPLEEMVAEAVNLAKAGTRELVLVAQDTTRYGCDLYGKPALNRLLPKLARIAGLRWIRVMYTNPDGINDELLSLLAQEEKICPYLDMPVQHAHPRILKAMGRAGQAERFLALIAKVRKRVPGICLRTTLLSGFPGETESEHQTLLKFVREAQFDRLGVFTYSREQGTPAGQMPGQIHHRIRQRRCRELMETQLGISRRRLQQKVGAELECIIEEPSGLHHVLGRTRADAPEVDGAVVLQGRARPGTIVRACITGSTDYDLQGVIKGVVG